MGAIARTDDSSGSRWDTRADVPPDDTTGTRTLYILIPLFAISILMYAVRIYPRVVPKWRLNVCDYAMTVAVVNLSEYV